MLYFWLMFVKGKQISLNLGAREHAHALETQDHEAVTDRDDEDGHDEGKDEHADLQQSVPVPGGVRENQLAVNNAGGCVDTCTETETRTFITSTLFFTCLALFRHLFLVPLKCV